MVCDVQELLNGSIVRWLTHSATREVENSPALSASRKVASMPLAILGRNALIMNWYPKARESHTFEDGIGTRKNAA